MIYNIEQLIHKIRNTPELKKLNNFECFQNVLKTLDNRLSNGIEKIRYKNKVVIIFACSPNHLRLFVVSQKYSSHIYQGVKSP